jgi:hypothetical protein
VILDSRGNELIFSRLGFVLAAPRAAGKAGKAVDLVANIHIETETFEPDSEPKTEPQ